VDHPPHFYATRFPRRDGLIVAIDEYWATLRGAAGLAHDARASRPQRFDPARVAKTITLLESTRADHRPRAADAQLAKAITLLPHHRRADALLNALLPPPASAAACRAWARAPSSRRWACSSSSGHRVAVLAVDPSSSSVSGGSILGDKTRMERLSRARARLHPPQPQPAARWAAWPRRRARRCWCARPPATTS
jgi:hypothetical protein